jgi:hypothetical protein
MQSVARRLLQGLASVKLQQELALEAQQRPCISYPELLQHIKRRWGTWGWFPGGGWAQQPLRKHLAERHTPPCLPV